MNHSMPQEKIKRKIRVLIIDDALVARRMVSEILSADPEIEVAGMAENGREGLERIFHLNPDLVILDMEMPEMRGLEAQKEIRKGHKTLPVIMFSSLTHHGAAATLDALALGANDYVTKPKADGGLNAAREAVRGELVPKIKALCLPEKGLEVPILPTLTGGRRISPSKSFDKCIEVLAIGVSTGGPMALSSLLKKIPGDFPIPVLVVAHMPALFTKILGERLSLVSPLPVSEGAQGVIVEPGHVFLAPGGFHMLVARSSKGIQLQVHQGPLENSCRPAVDVLFRSVAKIYEDRTLAVVLTGMGQDGLRGCEEIHQCGGEIWVQDQASSVVWGMPGIVAKAGLAHKVFSLDDLAEEILKRVKKGRNSLI